MLTPNQVLLLPQFDTTFWTQLANHLAQRDAAACILGIKWRRSNGGRIWVRPQLLQEEVRNRAVTAKNVAQGRPALDELATRSGLISVTGLSLGGAPDELMKATVKRISDILGQPLTQGQDGSALRNNEWAAICKPATTAWAGQLRIVLDSQDNLKKVHDQLHGMPLWTGSSWSQVTVSNPLLPVFKASPQRGCPAGRA